MVCPAIGQRGYGIHPPHIDIVDEQFIALGPEDHLSATQPLGAKDLVDVAQADLRLAQHVVGQHIATGVLHIDAAPLQTKVGQSSC